MTMETWLNLLAQIEIIELPSGSDIWTQEELSQFEKETDIILPQNYKEYCQVFGSGQFGDYMTIYAPYPYLSSMSLENIKEEIVEFPEPQHGKKMNVESLNELLNSAFVFGTNSICDIAFWDLRTYSDSDRNYDIYFANSDYFGGDIYLLGRDFYEFVRDFCLGLKSYEVLPADKRPRSEEISLVFARAQREHLRLEEQRYLSFKKHESYLKTLYYQE